MDSSPRIILPSTDYRQSYIAYVEELRLRGEPFIPFVLGFPYDDFPGLVKKYHDLSRGIGLPANFVPHTTYWLIDQNDEVVAVSNLRHQLNQKLELEGGHIGYGVRPSKRQHGFGYEVLRLTLLEAKKMGIETVLITCGKQNLGSQKIILKNAGTFASEHFSEDRQETILRYWIEV